MWGESETHGSAGAQELPPRISRMTRTGWHREGSGLVEGGPGAAPPACSGRGGPPRTMAMLRSRRPARRSRGPRAAASG